MGTQFSHTRKKTRDAIRTYQIILKNVQQQHFKKITNI